MLGKGAALGGRRAVELPRDGARREGLMAEGHLVQRGCRAHLQMLEVGTLGIVADDSLHEVPGQQQAAGVLSQAIHAGVWDSQVPEVGAAEARHGGRVRGAGRGGRRAWFTLLEGQL